MNKTTQRRLCPRGGRITAESVAGCRRNTHSSCCVVRFLGLIEVPKCIHNANLVRQIGSTDYQRKLRTPLLIFNP